MSDDMWCGEQSLKYLVDRHKRDDYIIRQFFEKEESINYLRSKIPIGIDRESNDILFLPLTKSKRIGLFAKTRTGKTFLLQNIISRFYYAGGGVAIPTDIKNEYYSCEQPVQAEFRKFLLKKSTRFPYDEQPAGLPVRNYYPAFLARYAFAQQSVNEIAETTQFRLQNLSSYDFLTLADLSGTDKISPHQRFAIENVFREIQAGKIKTLKDFAFKIENLEAIPTQSKPLIYSAINSIQEDEVVGDKYPSPDFVQDIIRGFVPTLNLYGTLRAGKNLNFYASAYVAIILRQLYAAKAEHRIKVPLLLPLDEVRSFCPKDGDPSSKGAILDLVRLAAMENVSMCFCFQDLNDAVDLITKSLNYIFLPRNMPIDDMCTVIKHYAPKNFTENWRFKSDVIKSRNAMKRHEWQVIDIEKGEIISDCFRALSPLCAHHSEPG